MMPVGHRANQVNCCHARSKITNNGHLQRHDVFLEKYYSTQSIVPSSLGTRNTSQAGHCRIINFPNTPTQTQSSCCWLTKPQTLPMNASHSNPPNAAATKPKKQSKKTKEEQTIFFSTIPELALNVLPVEGPFGLYHKKRTISVSALPDAERSVYKVMIPTTERKWYSLSCGCAGEQKPATSLPPKRQFPFKMISS